MYFIKFRLILLDPKDSCNLKAFLESDIGQKLLKNKANGDLRRVISKIELQNIQIPYPDYDTRKNIAFKSKEICHSIYMALSSLESSRQEFNYIFNNKGKIIK